jgi:P-type E1-E2 ATPase
VAIFDARFHFFCSRHRCRARFMGEPEREPPEPVTPRPARPVEVDAVLPPVQPAVATTIGDSVPKPIPVDDRGEFIEPVIEPVLSEVAPESTPERRELGFVLVSLTLIAGALTMALELAEATRLVRVARVVLLGVGTCALLGRALTMRRDPAWAHRILVFAAPVFGAVTAGAALAMGDATQVSRASFVAGTILTAAAANLWLVELASRPVEAGRRWVAQRLDVPARRVTDDIHTLGAKELTLDVKPGEHVIVEAGDTVPVDLEILSGEVEILPWVGAATRVRRRPGDVVVAGSRVTQGQLRGQCTWAGEERALARPMLAEARRADIHAALPRSGRLVAERVAPAAAVLLAALFAIFGWGALDVTMVAVAVYAAIGNVAVGTLAALAVARGVRSALSRGVVYNGADAWDACARVTVAVFCARGTLLRGEPELVEIEVFQHAALPNGDDEVLTLAAGALAAEQHPAAVAVRRAAADRNLAPQPVRNVRSFDGRGVTAVAATGEELCVGTRNLLLERRVSVAAAEQKIYELEIAGRTVMLVAKAGRVIGLLALKDGLRAGARAAVQHVLDARIEPVLMSADTRQTCEALGRALDIDHLRPEVREEERAAAIQRIRDTGAAVAVLGHTPHDDDALEAADASVVVGGAGRERDRFSVALVSDDVRDASVALALAHRTHAQAATVLGLALVPGVLGALVVAFAILPAEYAPLAQLLGSVAAVWQLRLSDR